VVRDRPDRPRTDQFQLKTVNDVYQDLVQATKKRQKYAKFDKIKWNRGVQARGRADLVPLPDDVDMEWDEL